MDCIHVHSIAETVDDRDSSRRGNSDRYRHRSEFCQRRLVSCGRTKFIFFLLVVGGILGVKGKQSSTVIVSNDNWVFLDKFVFDDSGMGSFMYEVELQADEVSGINDFQYVCSAKPGAGGNITFSDCEKKVKATSYLLFYNDVENSKSNWNDVYRDRTTSCQDKSASAQQPIPLESGIVNKGQIEVKSSARPRFWYVVLANCQASKLSARVELTFYNEGWRSKSLTHQFGFDQKGLLEMSIFFFISYTIGFFFITCIIRSFVARGIMHEIHWLLVASYSAYLCTHLLNMVNYCRYAQDGIGVYWLPIFSRCFEVSGFVVFINVLLLIARGWTITTNKLSRTSENALLTFVIVCIYIALFFSETMVDPATTTYLYDSWPGYLFVGMNMFILILFLVLLQRTYVFEKRVVKRSFYKRFGILFFIWFFQLPIFVWIARSIPPYYQGPVLMGLQWTVQMLAFFLIPTLSKPKSAYEIYTTDHNYDHRIPSLARQQRVQPVATLPTGYVGGLPPVNRNMTTDLSAVSQQEQQQQESDNGAGAGLGIVTRHGEGIIEN